MTNWLIVFGNAATAEHDAGLGFSLLGAALAVLLLVGLLFYLGRKISQLRTRLNDLNDEHRDLAGFLDRFTRGIRGEDGVEGAMHATAADIAEKISAEAVCIYEAIGDELIPQGVYGPYLLVHTRNLETFTRSHRLYEALRRERIRSGEGFLGNVMRSAALELVPDASQDKRFFEYPQCPRIGSVIAMPLLHEGKLSGVAVAMNGDGQNFQLFSRSQVERFRHLGARIVMVQQLTKVFGEISRRDRIDQELGFARSLQASLLPPSFPKWEGFTITAQTTSAKEVNGDFYDFIRIDDDRVLVLLGDACGKGIPACLLALMTRSFARSLADNFTSLPEFMAELNAKLYRDTEADRFITLGCCLLDRRHWLIEFGRAGHTDLVTFVHNHLRALSPDGAALGILPREFASFDTICMAMDPNTNAMMYSDGLTEACNERGEEFGAERLTQAFYRACSASTVPERILQTVLDQVSAFEKEQTDDRTIVLIRRSGV